MDRLRHRRSRERSSRSGSLHLASAEGDSCGRCGECRRSGRASQGLHRGAEAQLLRTDGAAGYGHWTKGLCAGRVDLLLDPASQHGELLGVIVPKGTTLGIAAGGCSSHMASQEPVERGGPAHIGAGGAPVGVVFREYLLHQRRRSGERGSWASEARSEGAERGRNRTARFLRQTFARLAAVLLYFHLLKGLRIVTYSCPRYWLGPDEHVR